MKISKYIDWINSIFENYENKLNNEDLIHFKDYFINSILNILEQDLMDNEYENYSIEDISYESLENVIIPDIEMSNKYILEIHNDILKKVNNIITNVNNYNEELLTQNLFTILDEKEAEVFNYFLYEIVEKWTIAHNAINLKDISNKSILSHLFNQYMTSWDLLKSLINIHEDFDIDVNILMFDGNYLDIIKDHDDFVKYSINSENINSAN